jgi:polar amino acid transport system substrate-binding protein
MLLLACGVLAAGLIAAGCGTDDPAEDSGDEPAPTPSVEDVTEVKEVSSLVPDEVASNGTLTVAADATYPPNEFIAKGGKEVIGMDADMAKALAATMGLEAKVENVTFDSILPGLSADKYDLGMSSFTITLERQKTVDFVSYLTAGTSFYVSADGGPDVSSLEDLCGLTVAVERGTTQEVDASDQSDKCTSAGDDEVKVDVYPDQNGANLAISSDRADVGMADSPVAAYIVEKSNGKFELSGEPYGEAPYGIAMAKGSGLEKAVQAGMEALIEDGVYTEILENWGLEGGAIDTPEINPQDVPAK